jgi:hypothetical protein
MTRAILFVAFAALCGAQTTVNGGRDYKGTLKASGSVSVVDFTNSGSTAPAKAGTSPSRPTACTQGQMYFATDVAAGQNLYFCTVTGAPGVWTQMSGGGSGSGTTAYISSLIAGPDLTRTITGGTHGFTTKALLVGVYDNASPRNAISAGWTVHPTTYDVGITFASPQSNYYVVINGGIGPAGPAGPTGPAGSSAAGGAGAVQTSNGSSGLADGGCTLVSGVINCVPAGGAAGSHAFPQGTANTPPVNSVGFQAPASVPSAYLITLPSAPSTGYVKRTSASPSIESVGAIAAADVPATPVSIAATTHTVTAPREYFFCTTGAACSVTLPVPAAGYEFCVRSDNNVSTAITLAARASIFYEKTDRTGWGSSGGTLVSGAAVTNQICVVGHDATHYAIMSSVGTWTAN